MTDGATIKPVLVDVIKPPNCEGPPTCSSDGNITKQEKKNFWQCLFGERKCKICLLKKTDCVCRENKKKFKRVETHDYTNCEHKGKVLIFRSPNEIQNRRKCLHKCGVPYIHSGCGCHFYFCIDTKQENPQIKSKCALFYCSEKISNIQMQKYVAGCRDSDSGCGEQIKVTLFCDKSSQNVNTGYAYTNIAKAEPLVYNLPNITNLPNNTSLLPDVNKCKEEKAIENIANESYLDKTTSYQTVKYNNGTIEIGKGNVPVQNKKSKCSLIEEKEIARHNPLEKQQTAENQKESDLNQTVMEESPVTAAETNKTINLSTKSKNIVSRNKLTNAVDNNKTKGTEDENQLPIIKKKSDKSLKSIVVSSSNVTLIMKSETKYGDEDKNFKNTSLKENVAKDSDEENNLFNYDRKKSKRRTSAKSGFVRNSLITLRQRRQSQMEDTMNIILEKLDNIEDKIDKLGSRCSKKDSSVVKRMSSNRNESNIMIQITNCEKNNQTQNISVSEALTPSKKACMKTFNMHSQGENVCIKSPQEVTVIKVKDDISKPEALAAHTIVPPSKRPRTLVCKNPKILIENLPNNKSSKKVFCDKWRRVSEELKMDQPEFSSSCYE